MIHYTGDIHQPLHATSRVDHEFPKGDRGGNSVSLPSRSGAKNLHSVWDSVVYAQTDDFDTPFSDSDWDKLGAYAADLVKTYPASSADLASLDPKVWANDSFAIANSFLYKGITVGTALTDEYVKQGEIDAKTQIVIGGTRLANLLISVYGAKTEEATPAAEVSKFLQ